MQISQEQKQALGDKLGENGLTLCMVQEVLRPGDEFAQMVVSFIQHEAEKAAAARLRTWVRPTGERLQEALSRTGTNRP